MTERSYILHAPCRFLENYETIMNRAAALGQQAGRADDWMPSSLDVALLEILLFGHASKDTGVVFLPSDTPTSTAYRCPIRLALEFHPTTIRKKGSLLLPSGWQDTLDNGLMVLLNSGDSPVDYGVEVDDREPSVSNHQVIADRQAVAAFRCDCAQMPPASLFAKQAEASSYK